MPEGLSGWQTLCHRLVLHHWAIRGRKVVEMLPSHGTSASNACASVSWQRWARCSRSGVAGGVPPLGAFNGIGAKLVVLASSVCWVLGNLPRLYRVTGHLPLGGLSLASLASVPTSQVFIFLFVHFFKFFYLFSLFFFRLCITVSG